MELRVLGPLEIRVRDEAIPLGGAKQRAVLATLLLRSGEVVSGEQLADELWSENPPASAAHTLEVYVSRIRQLLNGHGPSLLRRGAGYTLELGVAALDARTFVDLVEDAARAAAVDDHARVLTSGNDALALWHGPALAGDALGPLARAEAERLEELRLRTLELCIDAQLGLGRHDDVVGELQPLVAQNPYRERFVAQVMLALYRSGRHAEALDAYEQMRRRLDDDLGLQPSADLQQLSAQIVRQEPELRRPAQEHGQSPRHQAPGSRARRLSSLVAVGAAVAAAMALSAAGGARQPEASAAAPTTRVALVVQDIPAAGSYVVWRRNELTNALDGLGSFADVDSQLLQISEDLSSSDVERVVDRLAATRFDLVLLALNRDGTEAFAQRVRRLPSTHFVFIDSSLDELALTGAPNATAIRFATEGPAQLAGALGALVRPHASEKRRADVISAVVGMRTPETERVLAAFRTGVERALPSARVDVDYTNEFADPTACELTANRQIDAGSDVVFVQSGNCGTGALAVARARGVWAISGDGVSPPGGHVAASIFKDWDNAVYSSVGAFMDGTLPAGRTAVLSLDGYNVGLDMSATLPVGIASRVVSLCSDVRHLAKTSIATRTEP